MPKMNAENPKPPEQVYAASELIAAHKTLGFPAECIAAALKFNGVASASESGAKRMTREFMERKVK